MNTQFQIAKTPLTHDSIDAFINKARMERAAAMHDVLSQLPALFRSLGARVRLAKQTASAGLRAA
jgi:hypothetical protein